VLARETVDFGKCKTGVTVEILVRKLVGRLGERLATDNNVNSS